MGRHAVSFRSLVTSLTVLLVLAGLATVALVFANATMRRTFDQAEEDAETIPAVDELQLTLLNFNRMSYIARLTPGDGGVRALAISARTRALSQLGGLTAFVNGPGERALYDRTAQGVNEFFSAHDRLEKSGLSAGEVSARSSHSLDGALAGLSEFRAYNAAQVDGEQVTATRWILFSTVALAVVAIVLFGTTVALILALTRGLVRPLTELERSMARFARGESSARVRVGGTRELTTLGGAFNRMADDLERARQGRVEFIASVAHDLRNPLTALKLSTGARAKREGAEDRQAALVHRQVTRLERMVEDLLDAARLEAGQLALRREEVDLRDIALASVDLHRGWDDRHALRVTLPDLPVSVRCDALRIEQVLNNLLSNALKYSPGGGPVEVVLATFDGVARLSVTDHGVGIAPADRDKVFEPFRRGARASEVAGGVGLGLWAAKRIVDAHGGRLDFESTPGEGTTFRLELPTSAPRLRAVPREPDADRPRPGA